MAKSPYVQNVGTSTRPLAAGAAHNFSRHYYRHHGTSGDVRGEYKDLEFTSKGSGETVRLRAIANGLLVATGGTVNALHATGRVASAKTVSGALNAARFTLEVAGTTPTPGGTLAAIQLDSNIVTGATLGANTAFIRFSDTGATDIPAIFNFEAATDAIVASAGTYSTADGYIVVRVAGSTYRMPFFAAVD